MVGCQLPINTKVILYYDKGSIIISGINQIPHSLIDPRTNQLRALALNYQDIITYLQNSEIRYEDNVMDPIPVQNLIIEDSNLSLRPYQKKAIENCCTCWVVLYWCYLFRPRKSNQTISLPVAECASWF